MKLNLKFPAIMLALMFCAAGFKTYAADDNRVLWGVKASADVEIPSKWHGKIGNVTMFSPGAGFTIGAVSNIYLGKNFYFEPGVSVFYSQYRYKDLILMGDGGNEAETDPKLYKWGIQIPLTVGYTFDFSDRFAMNVFTGPQLRYAFAGKIAVKNKKLTEGIDGFDLWGVNGQRRFDCSWKIGVGFPVSNFNISLEADLGITDLLKGDMSFRENRVGLGLSYYF